MVAASTAANVIGKGLAGRRRPGFRHPQLEPRTVRIVSIYERGPDGRLAAVRVYDDVEAPVGRR
jgi:hypothetical protein